MALSKKKTVKKAATKAAPKAPSKNYEAAYKYLVNKLHWGGRCKEDIAAANELL